MEETTPKLPTVLLHPKVLYQFNINPQDQYFTAPKRSKGDFDRLKKVTDNINKLMAEVTLLSTTMIYYLQAEISEPFSGDYKSQGPRIHYHGYIYFKSSQDILQFLLYGAPLIMATSTIKIDTIAPDYFSQRWDYCHKQELNLPTHTNIFQKPKPYLHQLFTGTQPEPVKPLKRKRTKKRIIKCRTANPSEDQSESLIEP